MNEQEQERYEAELRRTPPVRLPDDFMARLKAAMPPTEPAPRGPLRPAAGIPGWWPALRWLATAMALFIVILLAARTNFAPKPVKPEPVSANYGMKADDVQVNEELVSSFDVVAKLPGGQPVRFRCRQWMNQLIVTDNHRGVEIKETSPRVEVIPVQIETY
jgi:hypothetical protein